MGRSREKYFTLHSLITFPAFDHRMFQSRSHGAKIGVANLLFNSSKYHIHLASLVEAICGSQFQSSIMSFSEESLFEYGVING